MALADDRDAPIRVGGGGPVRWCESESVVPLRLAHCDEGAIDMGEIDDEWLTALALAADPDPTIDDDAVPFMSPSGTSALGLLPAWYMPPAGRSRRRRTALVVLVIILALLGGDAFGLCLTNGHIEIPL